MNRYAISVLLAEPGRVEATAAYPQDQGNYWLALIGAEHYEVFKVLQEFTGWDAPQPIVFTDNDIAKIVPGAYKLTLRERYRCSGHDMCWRVRESVDVTVQ